MKHISLAPSLALTLTLTGTSLGAGCDSKSAAELAVSAASGGKVSMDANKDGTFTIKGPDGATVVANEKGEVQITAKDGQKVTATYGDNVATDFPFQLPAGAQVQANVKSQTPDGTAHQVSATVKGGNVKAIGDGLEAEAKAKGYTVKRTDANVNGMNMVNLALEGKAQGALTVMDSGSGEVTVGGQLLVKK